MLELFRQIVLRVVLGNTKRNEKYKIKESSFYQEQITEGKEVYSVIRAVNGEMYEGLLSWFYGIIRIFALLITVSALILLFDWIWRFSYVDDFINYLLLMIFAIVAIWGITIAVDIGYQYHAKTFWILTKDGIIHSNVWGKVRHISYKEIKETIDKKKVTVRKGCIYIPYKGGKMPLQMYLDRSDYEAIPILNRKCGIELPDMSRFSARELVRKGGMGTVCMQVGIGIFLFFYGFFETVCIIDSGRFNLYYGLEGNAMLVHVLSNFWMISIGIITRILFYYPTWKYFRPYKNVKVR